MKRIQLVCACLAAVFAISALAVASASAAPEFRVCAKAPAGTGVFTGKNCETSTEVEPGKGKYYLAPFSDAKKTSFTIKGGKGANFGWVPLNASDEPSFPGTKLSATECASEKGKGTYTATGRPSKVEYKDCKDGTKNCKTESPPEGKAKKGVIVDQELVGKLVDLPGGRVGLDLTSAKEAETGTLAEYNCEGLEIKAIGSVIGEVQGVSSEASKSPAINFQVGAQGVQQQWSYPTASISEAEGELDSWQWSLEKIFGGIPTPKAPAPQELKSVITGEATAVIPSQQGSKSETKGELLKVVG